MSFPRPLRRSVSLSPARTLRLVVLGQSAVGKTGRKEGGPGRGGGMGSVSPGEPLVPQPPSLIFVEEGRRSALGFAAGQLYKQGAGLGCPVGAAGAARRAEVWGLLGVCREIAGCVEPLAAESN